MNIQERIAILAQVGNWLADRSDPQIAAAIHRARFANPWFTVDNVHLALKSIADHYLQSEQLVEFAGAYDYTLADKPHRVGIIAAGNIPLVGFHDVLCTFLSGHFGVIKLSEKDQSLMQLVIDKINALSGDRARLEITEKLDNYDGVIATGSNSSAQLFQKYFAAVPHIIRRNRNAVAILTGEESPQEIEQLGSDIFQYYGLGCRNVSKIYVPKDYAFENLLNGLNRFKSVINHPKYKNNYDYNYATLVINRIPYFTNEFLLLKEDDAVASRIATLHYSHYLDRASLVESLREKESEIQCVVSQTDMEGWEVIGFGKAQEPSLNQFADGIDTMKFLSEL